MTTLLKPVIILVPTFQYFNKFWNLNTEVDICVQFKYLSTRPYSCTLYIDHSTDYILPLENSITCLLIYSCGYRIILPLPYGTSVRFISLMLGLFNALSLLLYSVKWYTIYLADPSPHFWLSQCVYLLFCYIGHWLQIHFTQIQQTNYLHAFFFSSVITF
jgi:hypothetical protein